MDTGSDHRLPPRRGPPGVWADVPAGSVRRRGGGRLVWRTLQTRLSFEMGLSQFIPRLTLHQMSEGGHWESGTLICVLTWPGVLTPLNNTTYTCPYCLLSYSTDYAWYSVQI